MIFPIPKDIQSFQSHPVTWTVILLNLILFVMIFADSAKLDSESTFLESDSLQVGGRMYQQYLASTVMDDQGQYPGWVRNLRAESSDQSEILGVMALKDHRFHQVVNEFLFQGDPVQIAAWIKNLELHLKGQPEQVIHKFGLSSQNSDWLRWITYQFSHSSWLHLISNLMYILVFCFALETLIGGMSLLMVYLLGGFAGAFLFTMSNPFGAVPMVGASASASALIGFYVTVTWGQNARFFDVLSYIRGRSPWIYLPTFLIIPLYLVVDFSQLMSMPEGLGSSIAYTAHIGGTLMGLLLGTLNKILTKTSRLLY